MYQSQGDNDLAIADYNEILRTRAEGRLHPVLARHRLPGEGNLDQAITDYTAALADQSEIHARLS